MDAKKYNNIKLAVGITETFLTFVFLLLFVFSGLSTELVKFLENYFSNKYLIFTSFTFSVGFILSLLFFPLSYYSEFYLEHKYGLSNQTFWQWIVEDIKGVAVGVVIGLPLLILFFYFINAVGDNWWLYFAFVLFFFSVVLAQVAPVILLPIFYKITPIENEELIARIKKLGENAGLKVENVYNFNMSKNTKKANAAFTGLGKTKRIILGDTLLENFTVDEIETVIAHEMGHYKKKHILKNILLSTVTSFVVLFLIAYFYKVSLTWFDFNSITQIEATPLLVIWGMLIGLITTPLSNLLSRKFEYEADEYAVRETKKGDIFINTLNKLNEQNLGDKEPHPFVEWFFYSHPSIKKRIEYISTMKI